MIIIKNKICSQDKLIKEYPEAIIIDVTSKVEGEWQRPLIRFSDLLCISTLMMM